MGFSRRTARMIERLGQEAEIISGGETVKAMAVIQPMLSGRRRQGPEFIPAGAVDESQFLYIGTGERGFDKDRVTIIRAGGESYYAEWSETFGIKNETVYVRAVLRRCT